MRAALSLLPPAIKYPAKDFLHAVRALFYYGNSRFCPVCGRTFRKFLSGRIPPREDCLCPYCDSSERDRFAWMYFTQRTDLFGERTKRMLHVAPERSLERQLRRRLRGEYVTADLRHRRADVQMDITDIRYPAGWFDAIYCSHVLHWIRRDTVAMRELYRALSSDGWCIIRVPILAETTVEEPHADDPQFRLLLTGRPHDVRLYGLDFPDRLRAAGFTVTIVTVAELVEPAAAIRMGLTAATGDIYYCTKR